MNEREISLKRKYLLRTVESVLTTEGYQRRAVKSSPEYE